MSKLALASIVLLPALVSCRAVGEDASSSHASMGFWQMTSDEDNGPLGEIVEFRSNGTYIAYDKNCDDFPPLPLHVYAGDLYVTSVLPGKGPVSIVYHLGGDGKTLSYTSPRTRNNAYFSRVAGCTPRP